MRMLVPVLLIACTPSPTTRSTSPTQIAKPPPIANPPSPPATPIICQLTKPSPTAELSWMKQPIGEWLRTHDPAVVPPYCSGPGILTPPDPAFDAWYPGAMRRLARIPCAMLDARLITFRGAQFGTGAVITRGALPPTGSALNKCYPSEGPSLTFGVDADGKVTCVMPAIEDGLSVICLT